MSDQEKEQANDFSHLGKAAKVVSAKGNKKLLAAFIGGVLLIFIFVLMLSGGHHPKMEKNKEPSIATNNDLVFQQNTHRLEELRNQQNVSSRFPPFPVMQNAEDSKAMTARRNAPTQMYNAEVPASSDVNATASKNQSNSVLAGQGAFSQFANSQNTDVSTVTGTKIQHPHFTVAEGEFIHATLETAIDSDLPGMVRAVITEPVYAYVGERPIIPAGSRLIGQYASLASNGAATARVFVIWNRVITPSGISMMINSPGADALGRAGLSADAVDTHFWKIFGTAALLSVMGATTANAGVGTYDQPNSANMYRQSIASAFQQSAQSSLSQNLNIKPTLHIHQGDSLTVFVAHDIDLYNVLGQTS